MSKTPVQLSEELGDKLCDVLGGESEVVVKWLAVADIIGPDGRRWLRTFWPDGMTRWDALGMLSVAMDDFDHLDWVAADDEDNES
jgi:hypothetical protein